MSDRGSTRTSDNASNHADGADRRLQPHHSIDRQPCRWLLPGLDRLRGRATRPFSTKARRKRRCSPSNWRCNSAGTSSMARSLQQRSDPPTAANSPRLADNPLTSLRGNHEIPGKHGNRSTRSGNPAKTARRPRPGRHRTDRQAYAKRRPHRLQCEQVALLPSRPSGEVNDATLLPAQAAVDVRASCRRARIAQAATQTLRHQTHWPRRVGNSALALIQRCSAQRHRSGDRGPSSGVPNPYLRSVSSFRASA